MDTVLVTMLQELGLSGDESLVYLALSKLGESTAYKISKDIVGVKISNIYNILDSLKDKGLVFEIKNKNRTLYSAKDVEQFAVERKEKVDIAIKNIRFLIKNFSRSKQTTVKIYKGVEQIKDALEYGLNNLTDNTIYCIYPTSKNIVVSHKETIYFDFNKQVYKKGVKKIIISDNNIHADYEKVDKLFSFKRTKTNSSLLQTLSDVAIGVEIQKDRLVKIFFYRESMTLIIEGMPIAALAFEIFNSLYSNQMKG